MFEFNQANEFKTPENMFLKTSKLIVSLELMKMKLSRRNEREIFNDIVIMKNLVMSPKYFKESGFELIFVVKRF